MAGQVNKLVLGHSGEDDVENKAANHYQGADLSEALKRKWQRGFVCGQNAFHAKHVVDDVRQWGDTANQHTSARSNNQDANDVFDNAADNLMGRAFEQQETYKRDNTKDDTVRGKDLRRDKIKNVDNDLHSDSFKVIVKILTKLLLQTIRCRHLKLFFLCTTSFAGTSPFATSLNFDKKSIITQVMGASNNGYQMSFSSLSLASTF
jgi:hypothetical protein